jgi:DNA-directed RNA polymerase specialized sigma subunit
MRTTGTGSHTQRCTHGPEREVADFLDYARTLRLLEQARAELDEREQEALRLRSDQGLTWKHVATAMEVSEATARRAHEAALSAPADAHRGGRGVAVTLARGE